MRSKPPEPLKLDDLNQAYEVIGELAGRKDARQLIAKRRSDGAAVTISVFETPDGDEGNAISHLAADVNRLSGGAGHQQPHLVPILEGRWLGTDAFAIVTPRVDAQALEEALSRREEDFSFARIAMILREINAVVEWARSQKFVHRAVELDTVFLEPGSDRIQIAFAVRPLPRTGMPGPGDDARNIAQLARAMLTRSPVAPERDAQPLAELRPGLPTSFLQETEALLQPGRNRAGAPVPDVTAYISKLAMAEDLKRGELHLEKSRNAIKEAHRKAKEQIEAQRQAHEHELSAARNEHERLVAEQARKFAKERTDFEAELEKQRQALAAEREALARELAAHQRDYEALGRERAAHRRDCEALARERVAHKEEAAAFLARLAEHKRLMETERKQLSAQIETQQKRAAEERKQLMAQVEAQQREAAEERKRIAAQLEALQRQTVEERKQAAAQLAARLEEQKRLAAKEKRRIADQLAAEKHRSAEERKRLAAQFATVTATAPHGPPPTRAAPTPPTPTRAAPTPPKPAESKPPKPPKPPKPAGPSIWAGLRHLRARWDRSWNMPALATGVLLLVGGITLAASARRDDDGAGEQFRAAAPAPRSATPMASSTAPNVVVDSIGGGVAPVDSNRATITTRPRSRPEREETPRVTETPPQPRTEPSPARSPDNVSAFDLMGVSPIPLREGNTRLDSLARPARDTLRRELRRDSLPRVDSIPRRD